MRKHGKHLLHTCKSTKAEMWSQPAVAPGLKYFSISGMELDLLYLFKELL